MGVWGIEDREGVVARLFFVLFGKVTHLTQKTLVCFQQGISSSINSMQYLLIYKFCKVGRDIAKGGGRGDGFIFFC